MRCIQTNYPMRGEESVQGLPELDGHEQTNYLINWKELNNEIGNEKWINSRPAVVKMNNIYRT